MLNTVILMGRITHDIEAKRTDSGRPYVMLSLAIDRNYKNQDGGYDTDFINVVAWGQTAEHIANYFGKGRLICVEGSLRSRVYEDKNSTKHYITEVYADNVYFTGEPRPENVDQQKTNKPAYKKRW